MGSGIHKKTVRNIARILDLLREHDQIHIRGIARALELNPFTVSNIINKYLDFFLDVRGIDQFGFKVKLISLKEDKKETTVEDVLKYMRVKRSIRNNV